MSHENKKYLFLGINKRSKVLKSNHRVGKTAVGRDILYASVDCFS